MALDTRGLASGFAQGFGLADNYYTRQEQGDRAERGLQMQEESFEMKKDQYDQAQKKEQATMIYGKLARKMQLADEEKKFLQDNPSYLSPLNPEVDKSIEIAQRVIDPNDDLDLNSEEGLYAINTMFEPMINRGKGGRKRIAAGLPGRTEGTMAFELDVEGEDGARYSAPMTQNRGVEGEDDIIKEVPVESLVNTTQGYRAVRNVINSSGASDYAAEMYALLTGKTPERTKGININGQLVNPETGEAMGDFRTPEQRGDRGSGKAPADVQTAEWMVDNGMAPNLDVAFNRVNESRTDPARFVNDFVTQEMKFQESSGVFPGDESYRTPEQMREQAIETLAMIRSRTRGTGEQQEVQQEPKGLEMTGSDAQVLPQDGTGVQQEDGSYSGRVNRDPQGKSGVSEVRPFKPGERVENPDGSYSTERSITVGIDGQYMNIPTLWMAPDGPKEMSEKEAVAAAKKFMKDTGQRFPAFPSVDQAVNAAQKRSNAGGAGQGAQAPLAAIEHLRKNPNLAEQFKAKYGFLPEGF